MKKTEDQKAVEQKKTRRRKDVPVKNCFLNPNVDQTITVFSKRGFEDFLRSDCMKHIQQDKKTRAKKIKSSRKSINSILSSETDFIHDVTDMVLFQEMEKKHNQKPPSHLSSSSDPSPKSDLSPYTQSQAASDDSICSLCESTPKKKH